MVRVGFLLLVMGNVVLIVLVPRAEFGWALLLPLAVTGAGFGLLVSQLNAYTLGPISEERASEAAGVNSAAGSFGLSLGLALAGAVMLRRSRDDLHVTGPGEHRARSLRTRVVSPPRWSTTRR